jgi:hypothetical protein
MKKIYIFGLAVVAIIAYFVWKKKQDKLEAAKKEAEKQAAADANANGSTQGSSGKPAGFTSGLYTPYISAQIFEQPDTPLLFIYPPAPAGFADRITGGYELRNGTQIRSTGITGKYLEFEKQVDFSGIPYATKFYVKLSDLKNV